MNIDAQAVINSLLGQISILSQEKAMLQAQVDALASREVEEENDDIVQASDDLGGGTPEGEVRPDNH